MSLAGIAISIGVLVDSSVVMAENVMHRLREQFGGRAVRGDVRDIVLPACLAVGRPIVFSVAIMVLSFLPVFALGGIEGKMFHPLAYTKSFALVAVAAAGDHAGAGPVHGLHQRPKLRSEHGEPADPRRDRGVSAGPLLPDGPAGGAWHGCWARRSCWGSLRWEAARSFLTILFLAIVVVGAAGPTSVWTRWSPAGEPGARWPSSPTRLMTPLAREFMTPLDEGMVMDMPITVPRASVTEAVDDLKARDMVLCRFPEVDMVVGKAGRAETPTDPAPMDMIETMVNFRPRELWPRRKLPCADASSQGRAVYDALVRARRDPRPGSTGRARRWSSNRWRPRLPLFDAASREYAYHRNQEMLREHGGSRRPRSTPLIPRKPRPSRSGVSTSTSSTTSCSPEPRRSSPGS